LTGKEKKQRQNTKKSRTGPRDTTEDLWQRGEMTGAGVLQKSKKKLTEKINKQNDAVRIFLQEKKHWNN